MPQSTALTGHLSSIVITSTMFHEQPTGSYVSEAWTHRMLEVITPVTALGEVIIQKAQDCGEKSHSDPSLISTTEWLDTLEKTLLNSVFTS